MKRFEDKVALVTGAASGIGRATAERLAAEGASVVLADINAEKVAEAARYVAEQYAVTATDMVFDASDSTQCQSLIDKSLAHFGRLDVLVNCAGMMDWHRTHEYPDDAWDKMMRINLYSVLYLSRAAIPHLLQSRGAIVNISSSASLHGVPFAAAYSASKAGINGLSRSIAMEYADQGLRVNAVCPGAVDTPLNRDVTPMPDWLDFEKIARMAPKTGHVSAPEEIAAAVAYLASDEAINVTGTVLSIDGGQTAG